MRSPFEGFPRLDAELAIEQDSAVKAAQHRPSLLNRVRAKVAPLGGRRSGSASSSPDVSASPDQPNWEELPSHLLEKIFGCLLEDAASNATARKVGPPPGVIALDGANQHAPALLRSLRGLCAKYKLQCQSK